MTETEILQEVNDMITEELPDEYHAEWNRQSKADNLRRCKFVADGITTVSKMAYTFQLHCDHKRR